MIRAKRISARYIKADRVQVQGDHRTIEPYLKKATILLIVPMETGYLQEMLKFMYQLKERTEAFTLII